jgi:hypothetical protein
MLAVQPAPLALLNHFHLTGVAPVDGTGVNGKYKINTLCEFCGSAARKSE